MPSFGSVIPKDLAINHLTTRKLQNEMGEHTQYLKEILGLLKGNSPATPPVTQTNGHTTVPIGEKLKNAMGSFGS